MTIWLCNVLNWSVISRWMMYAVKVVVKVVTVRCTFFDDESSNIAHISPTTWLATMNHRPTSLWRHHFGDRPYWPEKTNLNKARYSSTRSVNRSVNEARMNTGARMNTLRCLARCINISVCFDCSLRCRVHIGPRHTYWWLMYIYIPKHFCRLPLENCNCTGKLHLVHPCGTLASDRSRDQWAWWPGVQIRHCRWLDNIHHWRRLYAVLTTHWLAISDTCTIRNKDQLLWK